MKMCGEVEVQLHTFLTLTLPALCPGYFTPGESARGTSGIGGWVGPRSGMDMVAKRRSLIV